MISRIAVVVLLFLTCPAPASAADRPRVLILAGEGDSSRATAPIQRRILDDSGRFDVRVSEAPAGLTSKTLEGFDLVIDDGGGFADDGQTARAVAGFVASGKGLVVTRGGGPTSSEAKPVASGFLDVTIDRADHPIVAGLNATFRTADVPPNGSAPRAESDVLASAVFGSGGAKTPVLATSRSGKGRVVTFGLGSDPSALGEPETIALFARSCEWAATDRVTLPTDLAAYRPKPGPIRALIVTGGHFHDAAFYGLFRDCEGLGETPVENSDVYKKDLRGKYDVIVMYDFNRDLDDASKKNLRDFVESGKGIVILHHALLDFQTWTWWSENVAGGRYRLQREGQSPSSSVKDDQQIYVKPAGPHPVLEGVGPFHIQDEAYKNLWMSDRIKPLLTTDNPTSDFNLAWVGPSETARVVAIQLGHGRTAFHHPSYRTLVHNAVRWAAGKTR
ncbi:MAG: ThuA domain-containing protein [Paludisphaera borealis]|uniref:ThuA domain-containing protein n=1 Tax=Paludisphaera borealis TaxID=1387353 RepID=UPI00284D3392|nr:ThuA domain-containing protein [Paludisphaera borealis]MDR3621021.1 ThuA domain-containing protein [Paludisphaera borealis]